MDINNSECRSNINAANKSSGTTIIEKKRTGRTIITIELLKIIERMKNRGQSIVEIAKLMSISMSSVNKNYVKILKYHEKGE